MNKKRLIDVLLLRPAFTTRNATSVGLVLLFFGVYVMSGGKVSTPPTLRTGGGFGMVEGGAIPGVGVSGDVLQAEAAVPVATEVKQAPAAKIEADPSLFGRQNSEPSAPAEEVVSAEDALAPSAADKQPDTGKGVEAVDRSQESKNLDAILERIKRARGEKEQGEE